MRKSENETNLRKQYRNQLIEAYREATCQSGKLISQLYQPERYTHSEWLTLVGAYHNQEMRCGQLEEKLKVEFDVKTIQEIYHLINK